MSAVHKLCWWKAQGSGSPCQLLHSAVPRSNSVISVYWMRWGDGDKTGVQIKIQENFRAHLALNELFDSSGNMLIRFPAERYIRWLIPLTDLSIFSCNSLSERNESIPLTSIKWTRWWKVFPENVWHSWRLKSKVSLVSTLPNCYSKQHPWWKRLWSPGVMSSALSHSVTAHVQAYFVVRISFCIHITPSQNITTSTIMFNHL